MAFGWRNRAMATLAALALAGPAALAAPPPPDPLLAQATNLGGLAMFMESGAPGMVLVVVKGDKSLVVGFGETAKGSGHAPDGKSLVRLNSTTKVLTTEMLAILATQGKLRLTDPLQRYSGGVAVPTYEGQPITLLDLATYSAGLPREMGEAPEGVNQRAWPTRADRWKWLPTYKLPWAPGGVTAYSNIGMDLLADAIETAGGELYPTLLHEDITGPLGMVDTGFAPTPAQCERLMVGSGLGGAAPCADSTATDGSGGLYSTGDDMAIWLRHNLEDRSEALVLSHAIYRPRQTMSAAIGFDEGEAMSGIGLGWVSVAASGARPMLLTKSGGGAGFMSYAAIAPGRDVGVFVVVNRVNFGMFSGLAHGADGIIETLATR